MLSNLKGSYLTEEAFNEVLASVCQIIECMLQRVKIFVLLKAKVVGTVIKPNIQ
jgi:hypothetical protein